MYAGPCSEETAQRTGEGLSRAFALHSRVSGLARDARGGGGGAGSARNKENLSQQVRIIWELPCNKQNWKSRVSIGIAVCHAQAYFRIAYPGGAMGSARNKENVSLQVCIWEMLCNTPRCKREHSTISHPGVAPYRISWRCWQREEQGERLPAGVATGRALSKTRQCAGFMPHASDTVAAPQAWSCALTTGVSP